MCELCQIFHCKDSTYTISCETVRPMALSLNKTRIGAILLIDRQGGTEFRAPGIANTHRVRAAHVHGNSLDGIMESRKVRHGSTCIAMRQINLSGVNGKRRRRRLVAWNTALAIAASATC